MKENLVIFGSGGMGREALEVALASGSWNMVGFLNDHSDTWGSKISGFFVLGGIKCLDVMGKVQVCVAVGDPRGKRSVVQRILKGGWNGKFASLIHPSVSMGRGVEIGEGTVIQAGCVLTTDIRIGKHVLVNMNATIGHDVEVGDYSAVCSGSHISGNVVIGEGGYIGSGVMVVEKHRIGAWSVVGGNAAVTKDVEPGIMAVGVPAAAKKKLEIPGEEGR